jgi:hypothetical protein
VNPNADGKPLQKAKPGTLAMTGIEPQPLKSGAKLFTDRNYIAAELPDALKGAHFLCVAMNGNKSLTCKRAGTVWFLTPAPDRNRDSQMQSLQNQGFEKVALPEVRLFNPTSTGNYCTLHQKDCATGETIVIGKWAVPIFFP